MKTATTYSEAIKKIGESHAVKKIYHQYSIALFALMLLVGAAGCGANRGQDYIKDSIQYCTTSSYTWRGRWWDYYERGTSCAAGEFWKEAIDDFQAAIQQRPVDQRRVRTYALRFIEEYFPHREIGIIRYYQALEELKTSETYDNLIDTRPRLIQAESYLHQAVDQLETSLATVNTARAKFYLNQALLTLFETKRRITPDGVYQGSGIQLSGLPARQWTNRLTFEVQGTAESDAYIKTLIINGQEQFIDYPKKALEFDYTHTLQDGKPGLIHIVARDYWGNKVQHRLTVFLDLQGPLFSVGQIKRSRQWVHLQGVVTDDNGLKSLELNGEHIELSREKEVLLPKKVKVADNTRVLSFRVQDVAGNVTHGDIPLPQATSRTQETRERTLIPPGSTRWASLYPPTIVSDITLPGNTRIVSAQHRQSDSARHPVSVSGDQPGIIIRGEVERPCGHRLSFALNHRASITLHEGIVSLQVKSDRGSKCIIKSPQIDRLRHFPKDQQRHFNERIPLQKGKNPIHLQFMDQDIEIARHDMTMYYEDSPIEQIFRQSRLKVLLPPLPTIGPRIVSGVDIYNRLYSMLLSKKRFNYETLGSNSIANWEALGSRIQAVKVGKEFDMEGILTWHVVVRPGTNNRPQTKVEVVARLIDVVREEIVGNAEAYQEYDPALSGLDVERLMDDLASDLERVFPIQHGCIVEEPRRGFFLFSPFRKQVFITDLSRNKGVKEFMQLIIFRDRGMLQNPMVPKPPARVGEAHIIKIGHHSSEAALFQGKILPDVRSYVQIQDRVMTK